jgi:anthranilate synthase component 1
LDKTIHHRRLFERIDELIPLNNEPSIQLQGIVEQYEFDNEQFNGFFGRIGFEFTGKEEANIEFSENQRLPLFHLFLYEVIIVIDQYTNDGYVIQNGFEEELPKLDLDELLLKGNRLELPFELVGNERSMYTDQAFQKNVELGIEHCKKGDVFQLVLSNEFQHTFFGDDFQVYRELRRLNPSPYLFYFDFEDYRLFGSSPEAQLIISEGACQIHPIAGTIPRTGVPETDDSQLSFLLEDEKENAEHTMLVDLARNDLSRDCKNVKVVKYKEVQHFSHVTHLVSKVQGELKGNQLIKTFSHSFPAGTLSGTPKPKALELIRQYEPLTRDFYGGSIGFFTPSKNLNMAIVIRSVMSRNNTLFYRAGAGVVID